MIGETPTNDHGRMNRIAIPCRTILPVELQVAKWLRLVKRIRIVPLAGRRRYGLLVEGRGFQRMLDAEIPHATSIHQPCAASFPRPREFFSEAHARNYASSFGLGSIIA